MMTAPSIDRDPAELAAAAAALGRRSIAFTVGRSGSLTYTSDGTTITAATGIAPDATTVVSMSDVAWSDFTSQYRTFISLFLADELTIEGGGFDELATWDPSLKLVHANIPLYHPGRANLGGYDPSESVTLDQSDEALADRLRTVGFLHVRGAFTAEEMAITNAEVDRIAALSRQGDDKSWWVDMADGSTALCRIIYASLRSEVFESLDNDSRIQRLGRLLNPDHRIAPDRMDGTNILLKQPGKTRGLSNIPWHQDCGMGGHSIFCPMVLIGVQLTGSNASTGNLQVVPGSAGQTLPYQWENQIEDVPVVSVDTEPGDVTVHIADVMHASPQPTGEGGRRTMYTAFFPPALWDHVGPGEAFNDLVRNRTGDVSDLQ